MTRWRQYWPLIVVISASCAALVTFAGIGEQLRPAASLSFLLICPGMGFVRMLRIEDDVVEWTLAIALSLAMDTIIASVMLYASVWSPKLCLGVLIVIALAMTAISFAAPHFFSTTEEVP